VVVRSRPFLDLLLQPDPKNFGWQEVYRDEIAVIYKAAEIKL